MPPAGQQRAHLLGPGGVVEHGQKPQRCGQGAPQPGPRLGALGEVGGGHPELAEHLVQRLGGVPGRPVGAGTVQVDQQPPVGELRAQRVRGPAHQGRLAHPGHARHDHGRRSRAQVRGDALQFGPAPVEVVQVPGQGVRGRGVGSGLRSGRRRGGGRTGRRTGGARPLAAPAALGLAQQVPQDRPRRHPLLLQVVGQAAAHPRGLGAVPGPQQRRGQVEGDGLAVGVAVGLGVQRVEQVARVAAALQQKPPVVGGGVAARQVHGGAAPGRPVAREAGEGCSPPQPQRLLQELQGRLPLTGPFAGAGRAAQPPEPLPVEGVGAQVQAVVAPFAHQGGAVGPGGLQMAPRPGHVAVEGGEGADTAIPNGVDDRFSRERPPFLQCQQDGDFELFSRPQWEVAPVAHQSDRAQDLQLHPTSFGCCSPGS